jgi:hypothetical protein
VQYGHKAKGAPWADGPAQECTIDQMNLGEGRKDPNAIIGAVESTSGWSRLGGQYQPLTSLIDDLNAQEAQIAYAKVGLACADRSIENIDTFLAYLRS